MFAFSYQVDARKEKGEIRNGKRLEMVNYDIHFKQSFGNKRIKKIFFTDKMCIQEVKGVIMRNMCGTIFYIKTNVLQDFHICMSVPLIKVNHMRSL